MRVGIVRGYRPDGQISMDLYADRLLAELGADNSGRVDLVNFEAPVSFGTITNRRLRKCFGYFDKFVRYPANLRREGAGLDVYHITDHVNAYLISSLPPKRTIITCHDVIPLVIGHGQGNESYMSNRLLYQYRYRIRGLNTAAAVIVPSNCTKRDLIKLGLASPERIVVVYSGLNYAYQPLSDNERYAIRKKLGFEGKYVVLHVGSSVFYKNIEGIIDAMEIIRSRHSDIPVLFAKAGQPFTEAQKRRLTKYSLEGSVKYLGAPRDFESLMQIYNAADAFVFPSLYEGFGWPPLEAMACGVPVICSSRGSLEEIVGSAAVSCDPSNPESISAGITELWRNVDLRTRLIEHGIKHVGNFTRSNMVTSILRIYRAVHDS